MGWNHFVVRPAGPGQAGSISAASPVVPRRRSRPGRPGGLTLVELLVVLTILAIMATVAVTSTQVLVDQGRYEATVRTLDGIGRAIVDNDGGASSSGVTGFVADMGRLPTSLDELFQPSADMVSHQVWEFDPDDDSMNDIRLASGWRGPYLRLAPGQEVLRDGWGDVWFRFDGRRLDRHIHGIGW